MRIGILTLHDSVNYGALAQAYALRYTISAMGHDAFVMDRRRDSAGRALRTPPRFRERCRAFGLFKIDACNCERESSVRVERSLKFLQERVRLTPYSFREWGDAPGDLGLDALVVGSDQVWNANSLDPSVYLLQGAPEGLPGDVIVLRRPVQNVYLAATSAMALIDALDALDAVRMSSLQASDCPPSHTLLPSACRSFPPGGSKNIAAASRASRQLACASARRRSSSPLQGSRRRAWRILCCLPERNHGRALLPPARCRADAYSRTSSPRTFRRLSPR